MSKLPLPVRTVLRDSTPDAAEVERLLDGLRDKQAPRRRVIWWTMPALATAAVLLVVFWRGGGRPDTAHRLSLASGQPLGVVDAERARTVAFDDGSRVALEAGASIEALADDGHDVDLLLRRGRATFTLTPRRMWTVDAGVTLVQTQAGRFAIWRGASGVDVIVYEGTVVLRGEQVPGRVQTVGPAGSLHVPLAQATPVSPAPTTAPPVATATPPSVATAPPATAAAATAPATVATPQGRENPPAAAQTAPPGPPARTPRWRALAEKRRFDQAYEELGPGGVARAAATTETVDELLQLADVARLSGHPTEALPLLARVTRERAGERRAAIAAFTRGRICADDLHQPREAALAFTEAIGLGLPEALSEAAYVRLVESRQALGDRAGADEAARAYRQRHPNGHEAATIEHLLAPE